MLVVYYVCQGEKVNRTDALQGKKQAEKHKDINIEGKKKKNRILKIQMPMPMPHKVEKKKYIKG